MAVASISIAVLVSLPSYGRTEHAPAAGISYSVDQLSAMVEDCPNSAELRCHRARLYSLMRDHSRALEDFAKSYELDSELAESWLLERSYVLGETGQYKAALDDLNKIIERIPAGYLKEKSIDGKRDLADLLALRGQLYLSDNQYASAVKDLSEHMRLSEATGRHASPREYLLRGMAWKRLGRADRAESDLNAAIRGFNEWIKRDKLATDAFALRAKCFLELGDSASALRDCNRAIAVWSYDYHHQELVQRNIWLGPILPYAIRGDAEITLQKYSKAVEDYRMVLVFDSKNPLAHARLAQAYQYAGKRDRAEESVQEARRLGFSGDFTKFIVWDHIEL